MSRSQTPASHRIIGLVAVVLGELLLVSSLVVLASGGQSGRTEYSGLVVAVAFLALGVVEPTRARRRAGTR